MISLELNETEISVLLLNMKIMRKNVKKGFKNKFGGKKGKEILCNYDAVINQLEIEFEKINDSYPNGIIHIEKDAFEVLFSFLSWYPNEIVSTFEAAGKKLSGEDQEQVKTLNLIQNKMNREALHYA